MTARLVALAALLSALPCESARGEGPVREIKGKGGVTARFDLSSQVLRLDIPPPRGLGKPGTTAEAPVLERPYLEGGFVSASVLAVKAKQFDDGLMAAVELAAQKGAGRFGGKAALLRRLAKALDCEAGTAVEVVYAAGRLGGAVRKVPGALRRPVRARLAAFSKDAFRSEPLGFYTWSRPLERVFRQDRMLQSELLGARSTEALVRALRDDQTAYATYRSYLELIERLTNPLAGPDLRPLVEQPDRKTPARGPAFFPASRAPETDLMKRLLRGRPIPKGFNLARAMIRRIRAGTLKLAPTAASGWYDRQLWALEPLVIPGKMPEAKHLELGQRYQKQLLELFKGLLTLTRETHVKQLEGLRIGAGPLPPVRIAPELSTEPLVTHYARRAEAYRYVRGVLERTFGRAALGEMKRLTAAGPVARSLDEELTWMTQLFEGARVVAARQLGMSGEALAGPAADEAAAVFRAWAQAAPKDPEIGRDVRTVVPVAYDISTRKTRVWAFLGWASYRLDVVFAKRPRLIDMERNGTPLRRVRPVVVYRMSRYSISYPVTAEVDVSKVPNRKQFRRLCDRHRTRSAILKALARR